MTGKLEQTKDRLRKGEKNKLIRSILLKFTVKILVLML